MGFITNQPQVVESAYNAYQNNLTIVNNIPKDGKKYANTLTNFAIIDNGLAQAQEAIGSSSNIAQIAQSYMYSFPNEEKYSDYVCILAVIAQCAIDNAKRTFDIDINAEIDRISKNMDIKENLYPAFWKGIQDVKRAKSGVKMFDQGKVNKLLICPMNYLYAIKVPSYSSLDSTLPMDYFFEPQEVKSDRRKNKKVEDIISKYCASIMGNVIDSDEDDGSYELAMIEYEELFDELKKVYISNDYIGLTSWLIDRAFCITPQMKGATGREYRGGNSTTNKNKSILLKILYDINPNNVVKCFSKNLKND